MTGMSLLRVQNALFCLIAPGGTCVLVLCRLCMVLVVINHHKDVRSLLSKCWLTVKRVWLIALAMIIVVAFSFERTPPLTPSSKRVPFSASLWLRLAYAVGLSTDLVAHQWNAWCLCC
jgi:hypothetical protein